MLGMVDVREQGGNISGSGNILSEHSAQGFVAVTDRGSSNNND